MFHRKKQDGFFLFLANTGYENKASSSGSEVGRVFDKLDFFK